MFRVATLLLIVAAVIAAAGCAPGQRDATAPLSVAAMEPTAVVVPLPTVTATPTATPLPTPTPAPTATPTPLPLSFRYAARPGDRVRLLRPGVVHLRRVTNDPLRINVLLLDLANPNLELGVSIPQNRFFGLYRTSMLARDAGALAAVNGDLFSVDEGTPQGLTMIDGQVLMAPKYRATFAWSRQRGPFIGYFTREWTWQAEVQAPDGARAPLTLLNTRCPPDQICLYNEFARQVPGREGDVKVLLGLDGRVRQVTRGQALKLGPGERALQGVGKGAAWLRKHAEVGVRLRIAITTDPPLDHYEQAISGGPIILRDGRFVQDCLCALRDCRETRQPRAVMQCEDFSTDWKLKHYFDVRMPRTAVGYDRARQTLILVVVDGYQRGYSRGMTQQELADLLLEFGADTAMELDGGGSSTMVIEEQVVNRPPDTTGERHVANALLVFYREPTVADR
ncbi:MAG: phosphodiester glycosidase family protein [Oscillochloridaceae bacterium]|nr:phosphodiester glycosidase family protein [Chloroflexaceae bacterium]MDW8391468.1 phosphodiester glycosidase family protein [Oscillochloridaceae bacterium]